LPAEGETRSDRVERYPAAEKGLGGSSAAVPAAAAAVFADAAAVAAADPSPILLVVLLPAEAATKYDRYNLPNSWAALSPAALLAKPSYGPGGKARAANRRRGRVQIVKRRVKRDGRRRRRRARSW